MNHLLWCVLGLFWSGVTGHGPTTRLLECSCWDAHTHGPTPMPRVRYVFPPIKSLSKDKQDKKVNFYSDSSYDY